MAEDVIEWLKLPIDLQSKFFQKADEEAGKVVAHLSDVAAHIENLRPLIEPHLKTLRRHDRLYLVTAVDGSRSPRLSERIGVRYGVYTAGMVKIRGLERIDERYEAGIFKRRQVFSTERSRHFFSLLANYVERKLALEVLEETDLLILDGSFYGFLYAGLPMLREKLFGEEEKRIMKEIHMMTNRIIESGKAIAVIKRSHASIIGGWIALEQNNPNNPYVKILDKFLLTYLMPPKTILYYDDLTGDEHPAMFYIRLSGLARLEWPQDKDIIKRASELTYDPFRRFQLDHKNFDTLTRMQVRAFSGAPVCEIEYSRKTPREMIQDWIEQRHFFNEGTGLPVSIDLVDSLVNISAKFTDEFVAEVEARVLDKVKSVNSEITRVFFTHLNPQKPY